MNGCDTRQLRVQWRSLSAEVISGYKPYTPDDMEWVPEEEAEPATSGSMILGSCEEPTFRLPLTESLTEEGGSPVVDLVVEVEVFDPAVGG